MQSFDAVEEVSAIATAEDVDVIARLTATVALTSVVHVRAFAPDFSLDVEEARLSARLAGQERMASRFENQSILEVDQTCFEGAKFTRQLAEYLLVGISWIDIETRVQAECAFEPVPLVPHLR